MEHFQRLSFKWCKFLLHDPKEHKSMSFQLPEKQQTLAKHQEKIALNHLAAFLHSGVEGEAESLQD